MTGPKPLCPSLALGSSSGHSQGSLCSLAGLLDA